MSMSDNISGHESKSNNLLRGKTFHIYLLFVAKERLLTSVIHGPQDVTEIWGI